MTRIGKNGSNIPIVSNTPPPKTPEGRHLGRKVVRIISAPFRAIGRAFVNLGEWLRGSSKATKAPPTQVSEKNKLETAFQQFVAGKFDNKRLYQELSKINLTIAGQALVKGLYQLSEEKFKSFITFVGEKDAKEVIREQPS